MSYTTRISLDRDGEGAGVERQEDACRDLAEREGYEAVAVQSDKFLSAYTGKRRAGFEAVLAHIRDRRAETDEHLGQRAHARDLLDAARTTRSTQLAGRLVD